MNIERLEKQDIRNDRAFRKRGLISYGKKTLPNIL